jgi:hypothetical protein
MRCQPRGRPQGTRPRCAWHQSGAKPWSETAMGVDCLPMPVSSCAQPSLTHSASRATWRRCAQTRVLHAVSPSPEKTGSTNACPQSSRATKRPTMPTRGVTPPAAHCGALGGLQPATPWPRHRRYRAGQTAARALHAPAWLGGCLSTFSPPMPSRPRGSCSLWRPPRTGAMAPRNRPVTMALMAGSV